MTTDQYIALHASDNPATLALRGAPEGVDLPFALRQIEGRQTAARKLPLWAATEGIVYPVRLSMQQCSSQATAIYKAELAARLIPPAERHSMADLTGGLGVDFSFLAALFNEAAYIERDADLCDAARHNLPLILPNTEKLHIVNTDSTLWLAQATQHSMLYLDPARRDGAGRKLVRIADCQPDVVTLQDTLLHCASVVMIKLSPMLDVSEALRQLRHVSQVHIVAADGECKELLFVLQRDFEGQPLVCCQPLQFRYSEVPPLPAPVPPQEWLYIPSPAMMKAAAWGLLAQRYGLRPLHPDSHLFTSEQHVDGFPGRTLHIADVCDVKTFARRHPDIKAAGISTHLYPDTPDGLRRRLKLRDGMTHFIVATTLSPKKHVIILAQSAPHPNG